MKIFEVNNFHSVPHTTFAVLDTQNRKNLKEYKSVSIHEMLRLNERYYRG